MLASITELYSQILSLNIYNKIVHVLGYQQSKSSMEAPRMCKACGKVYKYQRGLRRHELYECGDKKLFPCMYCQYKAKQKETLKMHVFSKHKEVL